MSSKDPFGNIKSYINDGSQSFSSTHSLALRFPSYCILPVDFTPQQSNRSSTPPFCPLPTLVDSRINKNKSSIQNVLYYLICIYTYHGHTTQSLPNRQTAPSVAYSAASASLKPLRRAVATKAAMMELTSVEQIPKS